MGGTGVAPGVVCMSSLGGSALGVGATDGGVHVFDLGTTGPLCNLSGHCAGVLCMDTADGSLASGSEDGTVRLWDCRSAGRAACTSVINPWDGLLLPLNAPVQQLHSIRGPYVSALKCVVAAWGGGLASSMCLSRFLDATAHRCACRRFRFTADGGWLLVGTGNSALTLWSLTLGALAKQQATPLVPQAIDTVPGEILVAGAASSLLR